MKRCASLKAFAAVALSLGGLVYKPIAFSVLDAKTNAVSAIAFSPDGKRVLSGGRDDNTLRLWDARSGWPLKVLGHLAKDKRGFGSVCFHRSGVQFLAVGVDRIIRLWDVGSGRVKWESKPALDPIREVTFTSDATQFLSCGGDAKVRV